MLTLATNELAVRGKLCKLAGIQTFRFLPFRSLVSFISYSFRRPGKYLTQQKNPTSKQTVVFGGVLVRTPHPREASAQLLLPSYPAN